MMPWTLYRYILKELLKLLVPSALVLVLVVSFAMAVKPLSDGLLAPEALMKFLLLASPTVLDFALPFAGCFASALVMSRLMSDNEITACSAIGLSYKRVLVPVAVLGLVLTCSLLYLSNWLAPSFSHRVSQLIERDVTRALVREVQSGRPMKLKGYLIYADAARDDLAPTVVEGDLQPTSQILLQGVVIGQIDKNGRVRREMTAEQADVLIFREGNRSWLSVELKNSISDIEGGLGRFEYALIDRIPIPSLRFDSPMYMSWSQLQALGENPENYDRIYDAKQNLVSALSGEYILQGIAGSLGSSDGLRPIELAGVREGDEYVIWGPEVSRDDSSVTLHGSESKPVVIELLRDGVLRDRYEAMRGELEMDDQGVVEGEPQVKITLFDAEVHVMRDSGALPSTSRSELELPKCVWPAAISQVLREQSVGQLQAAAKNQGQGSERVVAASKRLGREMLSLENRITAEINSRAAAAIGSALVLILGGVLSLKMRGAMPLVVFFWTFLLTVAMVLIINSGENMATVPNPAAKQGLLILWSGDVMIVAVIVGYYIKLARN